MLKKIIVVMVGTSLMGAAIGMCLLSGFGADPLGVLWDGVSLQTGISVESVSMIVNLIMVMMLPVTDSVLFRVIMMLIGVLLIGISSSVIALANVGKSAYDALVYGIEEKTHVPLAYCRYAMDAVFLLIGYLCGGVVGIGTLLSLVLIGPVMQKSRSYLKETKFFKELMLS